MKKTHHLGELEWQVAGFVPHEWRLERSMEIGATSRAEVAPVPAPVPGSVQQALQNAGLLPDWFRGLNARDCEWVENRHWIYETTLPDAWLRDDAEMRLRCKGLDGNGVIRLNGETLATFENSFVPHAVELTPALKESGNRLQIIFECPPRWLGQFGYTSRMTAWKPRFNYFWDWTSRLVQIGIWDEIDLEVVDGGEITGLDIDTDLSVSALRGKLCLSGTVAGIEAGTIRCTLQSHTDGVAVAEGAVPITKAAPSFSLHWEDLSIEPWWPNGMGNQPLYTLRVELLDEVGSVCDAVRRTVGFKHVEWHPCEGAPEEADPWLCVVNGTPVFLQGVNWTPIRPNFADVDEAAYRTRLERYRDLNMNVLRVWGGAYLERRVFYELCDALGLLIWQEFPLSSSGVDNYPPEDEASLEAQAAIARSYIRRRKHHVSLFMWCGGNELQNDRDGKRGPESGPLGLEHPMLRQFQKLVEAMDPNRRFLPTSAQGPRFSAHPSEFGKGVHWDVHGPWKATGTLSKTWDPYWEQDDALMRSEVGAPGPSDADLIRRYAGDQAVMPASWENPLWRRSPWWIEGSQFVAEMGDEPESLEAYVTWGQDRQARALHKAAAECKARFPACGGFIVWMGHDSFPCTANTAVLDFEGEPKPAAFALAEVFGATPNSLAEAPPEIETTTDTEAEA